MTLKPTPIGLELAALEERAPVKLVKEDLNAATVEAIRNGEVDAFVVGDDDIRLLASAQSPYILALERMHEGAATVAEDGTISFVNESFSSLVRVPRTTLIGQRFSDLVDLADAATVKEMLSAPGDTRHEVQMHTSDGQTVAVMASMTRFEEHRLILLQNVTQRKLHRAMDARTRRFLAMLAHEFKNILHPIQVSVDSIGLRTDDPANREALAVIRRQIARLSGLVEDLREINRD